MGEKLMTVVLRIHSETVEVAINTSAQAANESTAGSRGDSERENRQLEGGEREAFP